MGKRETSRFARRLRGLVEDRKTKNWVKANPDRLQAQYLRPILEENWKSLETIALREIVARSKAIKAMSLHQVKVSELKVAGLDVLKSLDQVVTTEGNRVWLQVHQSLRNRLPISVSKGSKTVPLVRRTNGSSRRKAVAEKLFSKLEDNLTKISQRQISARTGSIFALACARFNMFHAKHLHAKHKAIENASKKFSYEVSKKLKALERRIQRALANEQLSVAKSLCRKHILFAENSLLKSGAKFAASISNARIDNPSTSRNKTAIQVADTNRSLLRAIAFGSILEWVLGWGRDSGAVRKWIDASQRRFN
jgi:hypothetical protein